MALKPRLDSACGDALNPCIAASTDDGVNDDGVTEVVMVMVTVMVGMKMVVVVMTKAVMVAL